ncbi:MAG: 3',5'-cyclic-nucleotide phosphodiesterase pde1 [Caeruleum heppii]|nr:MAG: 3',5'-cyclic-nucleotide phosphodiesterase pde1 [Caeruleum heppii]
MRHDPDGCGRSRNSQPAEPAFQVIILGSGGGPNEDNVTGLLVRSTATKWAKGSLLAVDAGTHLASITRILEDDPRGGIQHTTTEEADTSSTLPGPARSTRQNGTTRSSRSPRPSKRRSSGRISQSPNPSLRSGTKRHTDSLQGPFAGLELPHETPRANAAYITRELVSTYLITHPHLDHIAGFVINTASFQHTSRPKRLAALPGTIDAIKTHIFNDLIWPNLSDEEGGVGLVSYMRLVEGGNIALGEGDGRGYIEVCDGLGVKSWSVSHGKCMTRHVHRSGSAGAHSEYGPGSNVSRRVSTQSFDLAERRRSSGQSLEQCVYDSTAFFIRDDHSGREILIFGDVEPDSLSQAKRTATVWKEAAPKVVVGSLTGIFIECSYDDSQADDLLFGHLCPRHLYAELERLAEEVRGLREQRRWSEGGERKLPAGGRKRKRSSNGVRMAGASSKTDESHTPPQVRDAYRRTRSLERAGRDRTSSPFARVSEEDEAEPEDVDETSSSPATHRPSAAKRKPSTHHLPPSTSVDPPPPPPSSVTDLPLSGIKIIIIHMKDTLRDGPHVGVNILAQLEAYEVRARRLGAGLGCEFVVSEKGGSLFL